MSQIAWERDRQVVLAQLHNLILALRTNTKFSSKMRFVRASDEQEHRLTVLVKELMEDLYSTTTMKPAHFTEERLLRPFVEVVLSDETTEPITGVALSAFVAFLDLHCEFITEYSLAKMSNCAKNSKSEITDSQSHEAVLARILQVYVGCTKHHKAVHLPEESIIDMMKSVYVVACHGEPSELLRRTAEQAMTDMVTSTYDRVVRQETDNCYAALFRYVCRLIMGDVDSNLTSDAVRLAGIRLQGLCLAHTTLFIVKDALLREDCKDLLKCVKNELSRALLCVARHGDNVVVLSQMLRTLHLVVNFGSTHVIPQILSFLSAIHLSPLSPPLQDPGEAAPSELEVRERDEMLLESLTEFCSDACFPTFVYKHYDLSFEYELLFDKICNFLSSNCFHPQQDGDAPPEYHLNQLNVLAFQSLLTMMSKIFDRAQRHGLPPCQGADVKFALRQKARLQQFVELFAQDPPKNAIKFLREASDAKELMGITSDCSGEVIGDFLFQHRSILDKSSLGEYLGELGKEPVKPTRDTDADGSQLAKWEADRAHDDNVLGTVRFHHAVLKAYLNGYQFRGKPLLQSIREMVYSTRLPGEAQKIDRVMQELAAHWIHENRDSPREINPFSSEDAAFILSFSVIMLNTDLHSGKIANTMTRDQFINMNRGIDNGGNLPTDYLEKIYDDVKQRQIVMVDMIQEGFDNNAVWLNEVDMSMKIAEKIGRHPEVTMHGMSEDTLLKYDECLFSTLWRPTLAAISSVVSACGNDLVAKSCGTFEELKQLVRSHHPKDAALIDCAFGGYQQCASSACQFGMTEAVDNVVISILKFLQIKMRNAYVHLVDVSCSYRSLSLCRILFSVMKNYGEKMNDSWNDAAAFILKVYLLGLFPDMKQLPATDEDPVTTCCEVDALNRTEPSMVFICPGIAVPPQFEKDDAGWFSFLANSEALEQKQKGKLLEELRCIQRLRDSCLPLQEFFDLSQRLPDECFTVLVGGLIAHGSPSTQAPFDAFTASFSCHMTVEVCLCNMNRVDLVVESMITYLTKLLGSICESVQRATETTSRKPINKALHEYWISIGKRVAAAMMRFCVHLSKSQVHYDAMIALLYAAACQPASVFPIVVCTPLTNALSAIVLNSPTTFSTCTAEQWDNLLICVQSVGMMAPSNDQRVRVFGILLELIHEGGYRLPQNVAAIAEVVSGFLLSPMSKAAHDVSPHDFETAAIEALSDMHKRLLSSIGPNSPTQEWQSSFYAVLSSLAALVFSESARLSSDALLALQRCVLDPGVLKLPPKLVTELFHTVIFPIVEKTCAGSPETLHRGNTSPQRSFLSPSVLISSVFGPLAGPNKGSESPMTPVSEGTPTKQRTSPLPCVSDEMQSRSVSILPKAFLHCIIILTRHTEGFMELWVRLLNFFHGLYTQHRHQQGDGTLREAIQESVKNIVLVLTSMVRSRDHANMLTPYPRFWEKTREILLDFDFSQGLLEYLDSLPFTSPPSSPVQ